MSIQENNILRQIEQLQLNKLFLRGCIKFSKFLKSGKQQKLHSPHFFPLFLHFLISQTSIKTHHQMGSQKTPTKKMEAAEKKKATRNSKSKTMRKGITENQSPNGFSHHQEHKQENSQRQ